MALTICFLLLIMTITIPNVNSAHFDQIRATTSDEDQQKTVQNMITRIIPQSNDHFDVIVDSKLFPPSAKDVFSIFKDETSESVLIKGSSGVAAANGFHYYLKEFCKIHVNWDTTHLSPLLSYPNVNITITSSDRFRYYQNVCTSSYTFVWWNWHKWEAHIDWMAMNGINLPLAFTAQEAIWDRIYRNHFNLTDQEIDEHFTGPGFLAWNRMGNIRGWGGPLTQTWHTDTIVLQKQIVQRMRDFGMIPVLPAFAGHVPRGLKRVFPDAKMVLASRWNSFEDKYCCPYLLDPTDPLFKTVESLFITELISEFGTNHVYNCDPFNEMDPDNSSDEYLEDFSRNVYESLRGADSQAVWLIQNWFMVHKDSPFWTVNRVKSFLSTVPIGGMIVLDLMSEQHPQYQRMNNYFGHYYIWCMLHNFGGTLGLFGSIDTINKEIFKARESGNSTMIGSGLTPEGINQNYVVYEFMIDMFLRTEAVDLSKWLSAYAERRYGGVEKHSQNSWQIFKDTIYNYTGSVTLHGKYVINRRPRINFKPWYWYEVCDYLKAWDELIAACDAFSRPTDSFLYDIVDVTRQTLQTLGDQYYNELISAYKRKDISKFKIAKELFLDIFVDLDLILNTNRGFLLGNWLEPAKTLGDRNEAYPGQFEFNARNQITLWGPNGEIKDYANKQWAGIVIDFFRPRWELYIMRLNESLISGIKFNDTEQQIKIFTEVEKPFQTDRKSYSTIPKGDTVLIAKAIHQKWLKIHKNSKKHCRELYKISKGGNENDLTGYGDKEMSRTFFTDAVIQEYKSTPSIVIS